MTYDEIQAIRRRSNYRATPKKVLEELLEQEGVNYQDYFSNDGKAEKQMHRKMQSAVSQSTVNFT